MNRARQFVCPRAATEIAAEFLRLKSARQQNVSHAMVYLWGIDVADAIESRTELEHGEELCAKTLVRLIQTLLHPKDGNSRLWIATRGAQATDSFSPSIGGATQSLAWGIGRAFGLEAPGQYGGLIDLDPAMTPETAAKSLLAETAGSRRGRSSWPTGWRPPGGSFTALKPGGFNAGTHVGIRKSGSYLITGGLGGVGLQVAKWAAEKGASHLVLLGRTGIGSNGGPFCCGAPKGDQGNRSAGDRGYRGRRRCRIDIGYDSPLSALRIRTSRHCAA